MKIWITCTTVLTFILAYTIDGKPQSVFAERLVQSRIARSSNNDDLNNQLLELLGIHSIDTPQNNNNVDITDELVQIISEDISNQPTDIDEKFFEVIVQEGIISSNTSGGSTNITPSPQCTCVSRRVSCNNIETPGVEDVPLLGNIVNLRIQTQVCPNPLDVCCLNPIDISKANFNPIENEIFVTPSCGKRNPLGIEIRVGFFSNRQSQFGEFPWSVAVFRKVNLNGRDYKVFSCGGSLIHPQVVLTVAHCAEQYIASDLITRIGEWNFESNSEPYPHKEILVSRIVLHPQYSRKTLEFNAALLILTNAAPKLPNINTVCLPTPNSRIENTKCISSGWGKSSFDKEKYSKIMKKVTLPIVDNNACEQSLRATRLGSNFKLPEGSMCAGGQDQDTCTGDGGSPLVCQSLSSGKYLQMGIVAWGIKCNTSGRPGVYTSVAATLPWIRQEVINSFGHDAVQYFTE